MQTLKNAPHDLFGSVSFILTDMDETLTYQGRLAASTYTAFERLRDAGVKVIPVTAAPAGWCDQMARMWPVESVIGENGGLFFRRHGSHDLQRLYWHDDADLDQVFARLATVRQRISETIREAEVADDQPFRLTSLAFKRSCNMEVQNRIVAALQAHGLDFTINNLWVLGWIGGYDKLTMARRVMQQVYGVDVDQKQDEILYAGDSTNDAPMFGFFTHSVGVSTVKEYEAAIPKMPNWITDGPGGSGFVEIAEAVIAAKTAWLAKIA
jgi:HAD superfamily hydrolase (TIGR01484 family)